MENLKEILLNIEKDFAEQKNKIERYHKLFIALYFSPLVVAALIYIYSQFNNTFDFFSSFTLKIIFFSLFAVGLILHFILRYFFHRTNKGYRKFINKKLDEVKYNNYNNDDENFKNDVIETAKKVFTENGWEISNVSINNSPFWHLVFIYLGVESDDY